MRVQVAVGENGKPLVSFACCAACKNFEPQAKVIDEGRICAGRYVILKVDSAGTCKLTGERVPPTAICPKYKARKF